MDVIIILIVISLAIAVLFLLIFYWNIKSGQYNDTYTPGVRMLFEDRPEGKSTKQKTPAGDAATQTGHDENQLTI